jgi:sporulation protein YlmC with PRC-barrel domain
MRTFTALASAAALAFAFTAPIAYAEPAKGSPVLVLADHSMSASKLIGMQVSDGTGAPIGTVVDVLIKGQAAEPVVVLSVGDYVGNRPKLVALPLSHVKAEGSQAMMPDATKQMMASMSAFRFEGLNGGGG